MNYIDFVIIYHFKIFLVYDEKFWEDKIITLNPIHTIADRENLMKKLTRKDELVTEENWWESISLFNSLTSSGKILLAWTSGSVFHEKLSDEQIARGCTEVLKRCLNRTDIPMPKRVFRTKWNSDPFFKGSYTYHALESDSDASFQLGKPIKVENVNK